MDSMLYVISLWWLLEWIVHPMPERTTDRMLIQWLCFQASAGILLFWVIPHWRRQDKEAKARARRSH